MSSPDLLLKPSFAENIEISLPVFTMASSLAQPLTQHYFWCLLYHNYTFSFSFLCLPTLRKWTQAQIALWLACGKLLPATTTGITCSSHPACSCSCSRASHQLHPHTCALTHNAYRWRGGDAEWGQEVWAGPEFGQSCWQQRRSHCSALYSCKAPPALPVPSSHSCQSTLSGTRWVPASGHIHIIILLPQPLPGTSLVALHLCIQLSCSQSCSAQPTGSFWCSSCPSACLYTIGCTENPQLNQFPMWENIPLPKREGTACLTDEAYKGKKNGTKERTGEACSQWKTLLILHCKSNSWWYCSMK